MKIQVMGVYREQEYSPGKVEADAAILDAVVGQLRDLGATTTGSLAVNFRRRISCSPCARENTVSHVSRRRKRLAQS
jgi:hypothetical protein